VALVSIVLDDDILHYLNEYVFHGVNTYVLATTRFSVVHSKYFVHFELQ
jgi:hypothetical protein